MDARRFLRDLFAATMRHVDLATQMRRQVRLTEGRLHVGQNAFDLNAFQRVLILAVGKAAAPMSHEFLRVLTTHSGALKIDGVVVGGEPQHCHANFAYFRGGHPLPDEQSRLGAQAMLVRLATADAKTLVLFLISGGASAMLELPLDANISIEDTAAFHRTLVHSGLPIRSMNVLRKHFSAVKGGRLALAAPRSTQCTLLISDVPEGQLEFVGSGPSLPDPSTVDDCLAILRNAELLDKLPPAVADFFRSPDLPKTLKPVDFAGKALSVCVLLSSTTLGEGAAAFAEQAGYRPVIDNTCDDWDYQRAADYLVDRFEALYKNDPRVCLISTGEVTVKISGEAGRGGRNQQFALGVARINAGEEQPRIAVLSAGSDGVDGDSAAAGAIADETTWQRAEQAGIDPADALCHFNSYPLFKKLGDAIVTGPTGNNIRDLRVLIGGY